MKEKIEILKWQIKNIKQLNKAKRTQIKLIIEIFAISIGVIIGFSWAYFILNKL